MAPPDETLAWDDEQQCGTNRRSLPLCAKSGRDVTAEPRPPSVGSSTLRSYVKWYPRRRLLSRESGSEVSEWLHYGFSSL